VRAGDTKMLQRMQASGRYVVVGETHQVIVLRRTGAPLTP
jgi:hypothetical protein